MGPLVLMGDYHYNKFLSSMLFTRRIRRAGTLAGFLILSFLAPATAHSQDRADCGAIHSAILQSSVRYCAYLPASYSAASSKAAKYPILYLLHGLGGTHQTMAQDGEWNKLQDLRRANLVGDFLVVEPEAWDTFYINSRDGRTRYGDFFLHEFIPYIERKYRVRPGRAERGITGFSMGGYGALRMAFAYPYLFGSVSAHSAAMSRLPNEGVSVADASSALFASEVNAKVFGDPIDRAFWDLNSPFVLAKKNAPALMRLKIYFDCGTEDRFGLSNSASELNQTLNSLKIPHEFHLYPGGHGFDYLVAHSDATFEFHWRVFNSRK